MEGTLLRRTWRPTNTDSVEFPEKLFIYDGGDFIGFLIESASGSTEWQGAFLQDRNDLEETLCIANEFYTPKNYFQVEEYPLLRQGQGQLLIPGWQLQQTIPSRSPTVAAVAVAVALASRTPLPQRDQPALRKDQLPQRAPGARPTRQPLQQASPPPSLEPKQQHRGSRAARQPRQQPPEKSSNNTVATSSTSAS